MNLVEAFRAIGPADPGDNIAQEAGRILLVELRRLSRFLSGYPEGVVEDGLSACCASLIANGPRGERSGDPEDDESTQRYLFVCLKNRVLDEVRRTKGKGVVDPISPSVERVLSDAGTPPYDPLDVAKATKALADAWRYLDEELLLAVLSSRPPGPAASARRSFLELAEVSQGRRKFSAVVAEHSAENPMSTAVQIRAMLDTRYKRIRQALLQALADRRESLDIWRVRALEAVIGQLRLKEEPRRGQKDPSARVLRDAGEEGEP